MLAVVVVLMMMNIVELVPKHRIELKSQRLFIKTCVCVLFDKSTIDRAGMTLELIVMAAGPRKIGPIRSEANESDSEHNQNQLIGNIEICYLHFCTL